jgi:hypothetical protein
MTFGFILTTGRRKLSPIDTDLIVNIFFHQVYEKEEIR